MDEKSWLPIFAIRWLILTQALSCNPESASPSYRGLSSTQVKMTCSKSSTESEQKEMKPLSSTASGIIHNSVNHNAHITYKQISTSFIMTHYSFLLGQLFYQLPYSNKCLYLRFFSLCMSVSKENVPF